MAARHDDAARDAWSTIKREVTLAAQAAAVITLALLVRRWTSALLGEGLLDEEVLREGAVVSDLMVQLERRARTRKEKKTHGRSSKQQRGAPESAAE